MFDPPSSSNGQEKAVIEVPSAQAGMVVGVVLGSLGVLCLAVGVSQIVFHSFMLWGLAVYAFLLCCSVAKIS